MYGNFFRTMQRALGAHVYAAATRAAPVRVATK
jgi:hypothetical protein